MRPRQHGTSDLDGRAGTGLPAIPLRIEAWLGHAWFARRNETAARTRPAQTLPVLRRAELILSGQSRALARRATRIPTDAIVAIGAKASPIRGAGAPAPAAKATVANDNRRRLPPKARTFLRELFFLLLFGATLAGTYYLGRLHAFHNVIVVPDTDADRNRIV